MGNVLRGSQLCIGNSGKWHFPKSRKTRFADRSIGELGKGEKLAAATFMRIISQLHLKQLPAARSGLLTVGWASLALLAGRQVSHGAIYTWTGGGASSRWSEAGNWQGSQLPHSGEAAAVLVFPVDAARLTSTNDLTNLGVDELAIAGTGYVLAGTNALLLSPQRSRVGSGHRLDEPDCFAAGVTGHQYFSSGGERGAVACGQFDGKRRIFIVGRRTAGTRAQQGTGQHLRGPGRGAGRDLATE